MRMERTRLKWVPAAALRVWLLGLVALVALVGTQYTHLGALGQPAEAVDADYGAYTRSANGAALSTGGAEAWLCLYNPAGADVTVRHEFSGVVELMLFLHHPGAATCKEISGGGMLTLTTGANSRVLLLPAPARELTSPGVVRLQGVGQAVVTPVLGDDAEVGALSRSIGLHSQFVDRLTLEVVGATEDAQERTLKGDAVAGRQVIVVVQDDVVGAPLLVRWEDPDWYSRVPSWGHLGVVTAIGLFLIFYRGRPRQV